ncbi:MAG: hypothetical protein HY365_02850 [Candidatus Aenigmarchaeota archaeon]|nr:hypothetical protein [Candidatus Aenigmarchaeota archaeon]
MAYNLWGLPPEGFHDAIRHYPNPASMLVAVLPECDEGVYRITQCGLWGGMPVGYLMAPTNEALEFLLDNGRAIGIIPVNARWKMDGGRVALGILI